MFVRFLMEELKVTDIIPFLHVLALQQNIFLSTGDISALQAGSLPTLALGCCFKRSRSVSINGTWTEIFLQFDSNVLRESLASLTDRWMATQAAVASPQCRSSSAFRTMSFSVKLLTFISESSAILT